MPRIQCGLAQNLTTSITGEASFKKKQPKKTVLMQRFNLILSLTSSCRTRFKVAHVSFLLLALLSGIR